MFRIGSALFIPAYLTVTLYRAFASGGEGNSFFVMTGKRECAVRFPLVLIMVYSACNQYRHSLLWYHIRVYIGCDSP